MEALLEQRLAELKELNRQVAATNQAGQAKVGEADALLKNLLGSLPFNVKGVNDVS
jgi:hypothetical protein